MTDRKPGAPGQYAAVITAAELAKLQNGEPFTITLTRDDQPITEGTPYSKAAVLPDALAAVICPAVTDPTPADALAGLLPRSGNAPMTGNLPMGGNKITGLGAPTQSADAVNKEYADKMLPKSGGVMTGHMLSNLGSQNEDISGGYVAAERRAFVEAYEGNDVYGPRRQLILSSRFAEADIKNALLFQQIGDTEQTVYTIYGTHNPPGMTLLWQNASPSSSFPAQVLSIPAMAKYNAIVMLFNRTGGDTFVSMAHRYTAESLSQTVSSVRYADGAFYASSRPIGISFENCAISFGDGLQNGVVHNARAIPYAVYGL